MKAEDFGKAEQKRLKEIGKAALEKDVGRLAGFLADASPAVRNRAVSALEEDGSEAARLALLAAAKNSHGIGPDTRVEALRALRSYCEPEAYAGLLEGFVSEESRKVRRGARSLLFQADPQGYPSRLLSRGCADRVAVSVYGKARLAEAVPLISSLIEERVAAGDVATAGGWGKLYTAVRALANIGGEESVRVLREFRSQLERAGSGEGALAARRVAKLMVATQDALERIERKNRQ